MHYSIIKDFDPKAHSFRGYEMKQGQPTIFTRLFFSLSSMFPLPCITIFKGVKIFCTLHYMVLCNRLSFHQNLSQVGYITDIALQWYMHALPCYTGYKRQNFVCYSESERREEAKKRLEKRENT